MTIWQLKRRVGVQLAVWAILGCCVGLVLVTLPGFWRGFGIQALVWGIIDLGIVAFGQFSLRRKQRRGVLPGVEFINFRKVLLINAGLDVLYILTGVVILVLATSETAQGHGWGVIVQGGFLLLFDCWHGLQSTQRVEKHLETE